MFVHYIYFLAKFFTYIQGHLVWTQGSWHSPSIFRHSCIFYFHWIASFFLRWWLDTPSFLLGWNHQWWFVNLLPHIHHNLATWLAIFSLLFLASMLWHYLDIPPTNCKIWNIPRYLLKKFSSCQLLSMEMSFSNCHPCFWLFTCLHKCMDRKYNGHVWCKVIITNIKNSFWLSFRRVCCLGHLQCM